MCTLINATLIAKQQNLVHKLCNVYSNYCHIVAHTVVKSNMHLLGIQEVQGFQVGQTETFNENSKCFQGTSILVHGT